MKRKKETKRRNKKTEKFRFILGIVLFFFFFGIGLSRGDDWTPPPWGLNLEKLNQVFKENNKTDQIKEDKDRSEIELQYTTVKSLKIRRGKVTALLSSTDPSTSGRLYGYSFEGKIFGTVIFFKDHPEFFPETVIRNLKEQYPQGKVSRAFGPTRDFSFFEYKTDQLYVFSTERGIFYYQPDVLEKIVKIEQEQFKKEEEKFDKENKELLPAGSYRQ